MAKDALNEVAQGEGDLTKTIDIKTRDEVGELAGGFNTFIEKIRAMVVSIFQNVGQLEKASSDLMAISRTMAASTDTALNKTETVASASKDMSANMNSVSEAMDQAAENVNLVALSAEQMIQTITEIAQNTAKAKGITQQAVDKAVDASQNVNELGKAAQQIGKVIETITDISAQVNLLALNATIEAAGPERQAKGLPWLPTK